MARSDGRYKCSIRGCRNYISNGTLCGKCLRPDSSTETAATPAPAPVVASEPISTLKALAAAAGVDISTFPEVLHDPNPAPLPGPEETEAENSTTTVPAVVDTPNGPTTVLVHCDPLPASGFTPSTPLVIGDKVLIAGKVETVSETGPAPRKRATRVILPTTSPIHFDADEVVRLYEAGHKVVDIAVAMGYPRGHGQNRTVAALRKAGVYKAKS